MNHTALIVDDEPDIRELLAKSLNRIGLETHTAANLEEAKNLLAHYSFNVCLTDMRLPDGNGVDFVKHVQNTQPNLPVAVITAHGNMDAAVDAMKSGAFDFVSKPVDINQLRALVRQAVGNKVQADLTENDISTNGDSKRHKLSTDQAVRSKTKLVLKDSSRLVGSSDLMSDLRQMIGKVSKTNAPIWITGESGTGKELIARLIHANSPRHASPFIAINCGAIPSELMESELFGHKKGSFTGAHSDNEGLFMRAKGGTLFLDEVAELPLHMQVKLLRAIQERSIRPVGASDEVLTDVRILSASHKNLALEADEGRFRHDLYYRLNVISVCAPSLKHRSSDIPEIANAILFKLAERENYNPVPSLDETAQQALTNYSFPGNVRELENILERAVALADNSVITCKDINLPSDTNTATPATHRPSYVSSSDNGSVEAIRDALNQCQWNRKQAAEVLGLSYRQLRYRIEQLGIDRNNT